MKRIFALTLVLVMLFAFVGCNNTQTPEGTPTATPDASTSPSPHETEGEEEPVSVAIVVAGGLGDRSFYDSADEGLKKLKETYGVKTQVLECKEDASLYQPYLLNAAEEYDFVVAVGWQFYDALVAVAPTMPDTKFIYVDNAVEGISNVHNILYAQNEGSFLVGYIAAKMSKSGKIGAVGGMDIDTINDFIVGYEQGAKYANPDIEVQIVYAGDFEDPAKGKESANSLITAGCDVIFQIAGKTGEGVFEAADEHDIYAIGVDSDQKYINPDVIICSMMKKVGDSIFAAVEEYIKNGTFKGGETVVTNMANGFIDVSYGDDTMTQQVSDELKAEVEALKAKIISGEIVVETKRK